MKTTVESSNQVLNGLLNINNTRQQDYRRAALRTNEIDLKTIFGTMADESKKNIGELSRTIKQSGGKTIVTLATIPGMVRRFLRFLKAMLLGKGRRSMLNACESGDAAAETAYENAVLSNRLTLSERQLVRNQQIGMNMSYAIIRKFRLA